MTDWMVKSHKKTKGLIIWKFLPFHKWHKYLIDFARNYVDELYVLVCTLKADIIPWEVRYKWVKDSFPTVKVIHHTAENPQYPEEHTDFWNIWTNSINDLVKDNLDYVFASEDYWFKLAEVLCAEYIPVNHNRDIVNVSWTKIRENPFRYWKYLPEIVKSYYVKKICICWPESTWKSTLTKKLAAYFKTVHVNEYARDYLSLKKNQECIFEDIEKIVRWHKASELALYEQSNKFIFVDTDIITTHIRSDILFSKIPKYVENYIDEKDYDLYLLLDVDVEFVEDPQRYLPEKRKWLFEKFENELKKRNKNYVIINWIYEERFKKSIKLIDKLIE